MSCNSKVHIVPSRKRHFEFGTRPHCFQYSNGVGSPQKGALQIELELPIQHGGRERRDRTSNPQDTATSPSPGCFPRGLLQAGTLGHQNFVLMTYPGENNPAPCRFGVNPECRVNLALPSQSRTAGSQVHLPPLQTTTGTTSVYLVFLCGLPQTWLVAIQPRIPIALCQTRFRGQLLKAH